jgi:formylglycine-generating enzyme required for sulfatase activity
LKKLKVSKILALAGIAAVLFGFASCDTNADDSSNLAALVLLGQKSGGTTDTPEQQDSYELTADGIKCNGVLLEKTAEKSVISTSTTITGAKYTDRNNGVFIEGRNVTLSPFIMGKYEVTQELYKAVMKGQKVTVGGTKYTLAAEPSYCSDGSTKYVIAEGEI